MAACGERYRNCVFCKVAQARYLCPRCEYHYCSVKCYNCKEHLQCTENFYEDCVRSYIKSEHKSEDAKNKMLETLKRIKEKYDSHEEDDDDDERNTSLEERIGDLDLLGDVSAEELWDRLTEKEKEEFKKMIDSGEAIKLIPDWQPWWVEEKEKKIVDITNEDSLCISQLSNINVKPLTLLTSKKPSSYIKYNLLNIIYGYVYAVKIYLGSHHEFAEEAVDVVLYLSPVLHRNVNFESVGEAVQYCVQKLTTEQQSQWALNRDAALALIKDVSMVIATVSKSKQKKSVFYALEDLHLMFQRAKANLKQSSRENEEYSLNTQILTKALRKLDYYLSWLIEYHVCLPQLIPDIDTEYVCAVANHLPSGKPKIKKEPLIQELNTSETCKAEWEEVD